jgi:hypothetical protein
VGNNIPAGVCLLILLYILVGTVVIKLKTSTFVQVLATTAMFALTLIAFWQWVPNA